MRVCVQRQLREAGKVNHAPPPADLQVDGVLALRVRLLQLLGAVAVVRRPLPFLLATLELPLWVLIGVHVPFPACGRAPTTSRGRSDSRVHTVGTTTVGTGNEFLHCLNEVVRRLRTHELLRRQRYGQLGGGAHAKEYVPSSGAAANVLAEHDTDLEACVQCDVPAAMSDVPLRTVVPQFEVAKGTRMQRALRRRRHDHRVSQLGVKHGAAVTASTLTRSAT